MIWPTDVVKVLDNALNWVTSFGKMECRHYMIRIVEHVHRVYDDVSVRDGALHWPIFSTLRATIFNTVSNLK